MNCPVCEGDEFLPLGRLGMYAMLRCRDCGYTFEEEMEEPEADLDLCPECLNLWSECECEEECHE